MPKKKKDSPVVEPAIVQENVLDTYVFDYIKKNETIAGAELNIKPYLAPSDQIKFVEYIEDAVFTSVGYTAALFDFACRYATAVCYTDIVMPKSSSASIDINDVLYGTNLIECIMKGVNMSQYDALIDAAKLQISNRNNLIASYSAADDMYTSITSILDQINIWLDKNLKNLKLDKKTIAQFRDFIAKFFKVSEGDIAKELVKEVKKNNVVRFPGEEK